MNSALWEVKRHCPCTFHREQVLVPQSASKSRPGGAQRIEAVPV